MDECFMNCIEIILGDIQKKYLDEIIGGILRFDICDIISSHFFDKKNSKDMEYQDIRSLEDYFCDAGTGSLFLEKVKLGIELEKVVIIISCNEEMGDITINFSEDQFKSCKSEDLNKSIQKLIRTLYEMKKYAVNNIVVGYEPATDDDMKMVEFKRNHIKICNEDIFQSPFAHVLQNILKEIC